MKSKFILLWNHYPVLFRIGLFFITTLILLQSFPREGKFRYEFQKGRPWLNEDLIAPFDFAISKTDAELKNERESALLETRLMFRLYSKPLVDKYAEYITSFNKAWMDKYPHTSADSKRMQFNRFIGKALLDSVMLRGIIEPTSMIQNKPASFEINLLRGNTVQTIHLGDLFTIQSGDRYLTGLLSKKAVEFPEIDPGLLKPLLEQSLVNNVRYDFQANQKQRQSILSGISLTRGMVQKGQSIISKGELVTDEKYQILSSLKHDYESQLGAYGKSYLIRLGQFLLIGSALTVFALFMFSFRRDVFRDSNKLVLLLLLIIIMVSTISLVSNYNSFYIYIVPVCIVPVMVRVFFDTRMAVFVNLTILIISGFLVPNSFEFVYLQFISGIVAIVSIVKVHRRSQFFFTSLMIFITNVLVYTGIVLIQEGNFSHFNFVYLGMFASAAMLTLLAYPLIFVFEKLFGLVTDVTLLELSDTNSPLLRKLATYAPGTFYHSIMVANIAEELIIELGGNTLLVRTGALYHDIGKIENAQYFIENQTSGHNPHNELPFEESAQVLISHVIKGIELAKKHKLPEQIIDFIRTHHGTRMTEFFYVKQLQSMAEREVDKSKFTYHGPIPFSKETAVLMMADSVEAASRSLKDKNEDSIRELVDRVINKQLDQNQFDNSNITMKDIATIKRILKRKLMSIFHVRVEYPVL
ncbi:MAG: HDIG domain-containing protein [Bacteroidota bacterium]|nr:HDIG domain-containing protein [Bacteroidota bacterium]